MIRLCLFTSVFESTFLIIIICTETLRNAASLPDHLCAQPACCPTTRPINDVNDDEKTPLLKKTVENQPPPMYAESYLLIYT